MPKIPHAIQDFLEINDLGTVEINELDVFTVMECKETDTKYINTALVLDEEGVLFKWTYIQEDSRFVIQVQDSIHEVEAMCYLTEQ